MKRKSNQLVILAIFSIMIAAVVSTISPFGDKVYANSSEKVPVQVIYYDTVSEKGIANHSYTIEVSSGDTVRAVAKDIPGYTFMYSTYRLNKYSSPEAGSSEVVLNGSDIVNQGWGLIYFYYKPIPKPKTYTIVLSFDDGREVRQQVTVKPGEKFAVPGIPPGYYAVYGGDIVDYDYVIDGHTHYIKVRDERFRNARTKRVKTHFDDGERLHFYDPEVVEGIPMMFPGYDSNRHEIISGFEYLKYEDLVDGQTYKTIARLKDNSNLTVNKTIQTNFIVSGSNHPAEKKTLTVSPGQKLPFPGYDASKHEVVSGNPVLDYNVVKDGEEYTLTVKEKSIPPVMSHLEEVRRFYHSGLRIHLYTKNLTEIAYLRTIKQWRDEGVAFVVSSATDGQPVYRLYDPSLGVHFYTKNEKEYQLLGSRGWRQEGISYRSSGNVPVYRLYNPGIKRYLYTRNITEYNNLKHRGWRQEGIAWYVEK